ncbi:hypothetical protein QAD02_007169 [Eretmocerus hayati]|uniref:Uncharacterized protein n=1 Tax=Eretmocerus hayati TaxID=131215 RepID=A0ACC2N2Y3_9HYME|nr:hypothetical protein QAD02_007169 [Eretmocerus hayati]
MADHMDYEEPEHRPYSPPPGPSTLVLDEQPGRRSSLQQEVQHLAEETERVTRLADATPPPTALGRRDRTNHPDAMEETTPTRRERSGTRGVGRPAAERRGTMFQWLVPLPHDQDDPPPRVCFKCWLRGHRSADCPCPGPHHHCVNCGHRGVLVNHCPRCSTAYQLWPGCREARARSTPRTAAEATTSSSRDAPSCNEQDARRRTPEVVDSIPPARVEERIPTPTVTRTPTPAQSPHRSPTPEATSPTEPAGAVSLPRPFPTMSEPGESTPPSSVDQRRGVDETPTPAPRTRAPSSARVPTAPSATSTRPTLRIPEMALRMAAMTSADHQRFQRLVEVAVTMPDDIQERMFTVFFEGLGRQGQ